MRQSHDVIIVGAGAAGLAALRELDRAGVDTLCLEARDRIGGRILTVRDPLCPIPIELGAEFIHGRPDEIWSIIRAANLAAYDVTDHSVHIENGAVQSREDAWLPVSRVNHEMREAAQHGPDRSFADFLSRTNHPEKVKRLAVNFVEGFNAARQEIVGIQSLVIDMEAADQIDGGRSFRLLSGYEAVPQHLLATVRDPHSRLLLNTVVQAIEWHAGSVTVHARSTMTDSQRTYFTRRLIMTVPLGVLHDGSIRFTPEPAEALASARRLAFGQVFRVVLRFREAVWERDPDFADAGFLLSDDPVFPAWWSPLAVRAPIITGWSAGPHPDAVIAQSREKVIAKALAALSAITGTPKAELTTLLEASYFHDWHADPFARGAYSYVPVNALEAREMLAKPVDNTLFFAGEATELNGHSATVHGAIASGIRAAAQVLGTLK